MQIGKREEVSVREVWPLETSFSDWLASAEGLELIASDIGVSVEDAQRECSPGDFRCDIVGRALGDENHVVVIENQFNKTDHDHLGKMLTYAAVHSATTGIWISERISDDHRQVIDWLNSVTPPNVNFYLAQIKLYRIGNSAVAPELDVVCRPNAGAKLRERAKPNASPGANERRVWAKEFWDDVIPYIREQKPPFNPQSPGGEAWSNITLGRAGFWLGLTMASRFSRISCQFCVNVPWRLDAFNQLFAQREAIEAEIGAKLEWDALPDAKISRVRLYADINPSDPDQRDQVKAWMHKQGVAFYRAFRPRVQALVPSSTADSDEDEPDADN